MMFFIDKFFIIRLVPTISLVFVLAACTGVDSGDSGGKAADTTAPIITLTGPATVELEEGEAYVDQGASASDNIDGDISGNIVVDESAVNVDATGSYTLTYNVSDVADNSATEVTRTVTVTAGGVKAADTTAPVMTLTGPATVELEEGEAYTDQGAEAKDNKDGIITANIVETGSVDIDTIGSYTLTYNVSDASGNVATEVTRTVTVTAVADTTPPPIVEATASIADVTLADSNFQTCFDSHVSTNNWQLISEVDSLDCNSSSISSISGIEVFINLQTLGLDNNNISDISALSNLTVLNELNLTTNNISELSALSSLTALSVLQLGYNNISDISALSGMSALNYLYLTANSISDISALSGTTGLMYLYLDENNISDILALSQLTFIKGLSLSYNSISDISALSALNAMNNLFINANSISDISVLLGKTDLHYLYLTNNPNLACIDIDNLATMLTNTTINRDVNCTDINSYVQWRYDAQSCAFGSWVDCQIDFSNAIQLDDFESWVIAFRTGGTKDDDNNDGFIIGNIGNSQALIATQTDTRDPGDSRRTEAKVAFIPVGDYKVSFKFFVETVPSDFDSTISQIKCGSGKPPINIKITAGGGVRVQSGGEKVLADTPGHLNEGWHIIEYTIENSKTLLSLTIDGNVLDIDNSLSVTDCSNIDGAGPSYYLKIGLYESDVPAGYRIGYQNLILKQL
tara:strand:- start:32789 stop:34870 length:2082 start_codon:yes stop_codon:yes gene_type:complete